MTWCLCVQALCRSNKGRLLYTHDPTIAGLFSRLSEIGDRDTQAQLLGAATKLAVAVLMILTGLLAAYFPARRAFAVDPIRALREE